MRIKLYWFLMCCLLAGRVAAQQFRVSEYDGEHITVEVPPCFDGAYLIVERCTNLVDGVWEAIDHSKLDLVTAAPAAIPASSAAAAMPLVEGASIGVPEEIAPEYIEKAASGEVVQHRGVFGAVFNVAAGIPSAFFRITVLSFVDSDGDGVDNASEFGAETDPYVADSAEISLPKDDGAPREVPGFVSSSPGEWNIPPENVYSNNGSSWQVINALTLALDGTNCTLSAETPVSTLGAWIESHCNGEWTSPAEGFSFPTVDAGSFYRTEDASFKWAGKEHIYPLALHPYDGSVQFLNHLIQSDPADPAGLAILSDGTPVLVNANNPWTEAKVSACLQQLRTVRCRFQKISGDAFDDGDVAAMAQAHVQRNLGDLTPSDQLRMPMNLIQVIYQLNSSVHWDVKSTFFYNSNMKFQFLNTLESQGFGPTHYVGYVGINPPHEWEWVANNGQYEKRQVQASLSGFVPGVINETFHAKAGDEAWFMLGETNQNLVEFRDHVTVPSNIPHADLYVNYQHQMGYYTYDYDLLAKLTLPAVSQTLVMDVDRDGQIGTNDVGRVSQDHPYRFWVNNDADCKNGEEFDLPAGYAPLPSGFYQKADKYADVPGLNMDIEGANAKTVNGLNDLEDFFPVAIEWPDGVATNAKVTLNSNVKIGVVDARLTRENSDAYLTELDAADPLTSKAVEEVNASKPYLIPPDAVDSVFLIEAHEPSTNALISLTFDDGNQTVTFTNYFSFSSVEEMYRYKNLRQGDQAGAPDRLDKPKNWPDSLCNDANYYYVHGFNVSEPRSRGSQGIMFKRLFWSGSNARFYGISWDGTPLSVGIPVKTTGCHYHNAVVNAFATAPALAQFLNSQTAGGRKNILMAHSLGNIVSSSAICDYNAQVDQYYMIDAAVAKEAYGDVTPNKDMTPDNSLFYNQSEGLLSITGHSWHYYPPELYASEWYRLFTDDETDPRGKLTWRMRFGDLQEKADAFNFYSSTEDILRVDTGYTTKLSGLVDWDFLDVDENGGVYAFQLQEMYKGMNDFTTIALGGGSDPYTGWGFTKESDLHITEFPGLGLDLWPKDRGFYRTELNQLNPEKRAAFREKLKKDPLFAPIPAELFGDDARNFAADVVGNHEEAFNYDASRAMRTIDQFRPHSVRHRVPITQPVYGDLISTVDLKNLPIRDYLLAKAFPARTGALGSRRNGSKIWDDVNFDMSELYMNESSEWPNKDNHGNAEWRHSDVRDLPYVHNYKFFDRLTNK